MSNFLLIHGSGGGAWYFRDLVPALETYGHSARAIDLPGHGNNPRRLEDITLDAYRDAILDEIKEPTILVGHSMAGFPIAAAAEAAPDNITQLIFLSAYLPRDGLNMIDLIKAQPEKPLRNEVLMRQDRLGFVLSLRRQKELFYHDCSDAVSDYAIRNSQEQALAPQTTRISLGKAFENVAKSYIQSEYDRIIPPQYHLDMV
jgi:pimeloyl-ACP methyl ester carboxylesterase